MCMSARGQGVWEGQHLAGRLVLAPVAELQADQVFQALAVRDTARQG